MNFLSLEVLSAAMALVTFVSGALAWYSAKVQKNYAAQRDFEHLKRNYAQMTENLKEVAEELDRRFDALDRDNDDIRQKLNVMLIKILPEHSTGWLKQQDSEKGI